MKHRKPPITRELSSHEGLEEREKQQENHIAPPITRELSSHEGLDVRETQQESHIAVKKQQNPIIPEVPVGS
ncbi:uncharacterized protein LOC144629503 isoform X9 [Oculina patagonica]